jgi:hypothetical protein
MNENLRDKFNIACFAIIVLSILLILPFLVTYNTGTIKTPKYPYRKYWYIPVIVSAVATLGMMVPH